MLETVIGIVYLAGLVPAFFVMKDMRRRDLPRKIKEVHTLAAVMIPFLYALFFFKVVPGSPELQDKLMLTATIDPAKNLKRLTHEDD